MPLTILSKPAEHGTIDDLSEGSQYMSWDSKLLAPVACFDELV